MKRVMTLVAGLLGLVFDAIFSVFMIIGLVAVMDMLGGEKGSATFAIIAILEIALGVVSLILNAVSISAFACSAEKYRKKRGLIITTIVFNFLLALLLLLTVFTSASLVTVLVLIASIVAVVLYIVDLCLEGKRVAKAQQTAEAKEETVEVKEEA